MISALKKFFSPDPYQLVAHEAYVSLVAESRRPFFYTEANVPDTLDGRFDVIALHIFLLTHRLKKEAPEFVRAVWEAFFSDMDRSLREMGASDTGIGKRIKKMVQAFYGRMDAYENALGDEATFKEALARNLYRGEPGSEASLVLMAGYAAKNVAHLVAKQTDALASGKIDFLP